MQSRYGMQQKSHRCFIITPPEHVNHVPVLASSVVDVETLFAVPMGDSVAEFERWTITTCFHRVYKDVIARDGSLDAMKALVNPLPLLNSNPEFPRLREAVEAYVFTCAGELALCDTNIAQKIQAGRQ